ncbi:uncharacterized protein C6orf118-like [Liolophura sinensis]|uniref:uncharacterized protein C6orf118-like n=1 Tax=Liolophura sinensis TaxID=3198878 RepID=UPI00315831E0
MAMSKEQLHNLLNTMELCNKQDVQDYTSGHLNESRMLQKIQLTNRKPWSAAAKKPIVMLERHNFVKTTKRRGKEKKMNDVLYDFTMGTSGVLPEVGRQSPTLTTTPFRQKESRSSAYNSVHFEDDGVYIEELRPQELLLPTPRSQRSTVTPWGGREKRLSPTPQASNSMRHIPSSEHIAILSHYCGPTKRDQYHKLKDFQSSILRTQDSSEKSVLSGVKAVEHIQEQLEQELSRLQFDGVGPNFHKLQVFSNALEALAESSQTFKYILKSIKAEYDSYISHLLDKQTSQHHLLQEQVEKMTLRGLSRPLELEMAKGKLLGLEEKAKIALEENQRLRSELDYEMRLQETATTEPESPLPTVRRSHHEPPMELAEEIEHVKAVILEKMDEIASLKSKLRAEFVPSTVCTHLEQCIKESQTEVQKLLKQNEYFEKSISDMEEELKDAIVTADTSERDARRIWRRVNSTRPLGSARSTKTVTTAKSVTGMQYESEEDEDDESKWNWYIS